MKPSLSPRRLALVWSGLLCLAFGAMHGCASANEDPAPEDPVGSGGKAGKGGSGGKAGASNTGGKAGGSGGKAGKGGTGGKPSAGSGGAASVGGTGGDTGAGGDAFGGFGGSTGGTGGATGQVCCGVACTPNPFGFPQCCTEEGACGFEIMGECSEAPFSKPPTGPCGGGSTYVVACEADGVPTALPTKSSCDTGMACNGITNQGCESSAGTSCEYSFMDKAFKCLEGSHDQPLCAACGTNGVCAAGSVCIKGQCARTCCTSGDCGASNVCYLGPSVLSGLAGFCVQGAAGQGGAGGEAGAAGTAGQSGGGGESGSSGQAGAGGAGTSGAAGAPAGGQAGASGAGQAGSAGAQAGASGAASGGQAGQAGSSGGSGQSGAAGQAGAGG